LEGCLKKVTIGFSRPKNRFFPWASWLIRAYQGFTPYSHTYLEFYSESINRSLIYEAVGTGVRFVGQKYWERKAHSTHSFTLEIKKCNYDRLIQYCVDHEGENYGFLQNIGVVIANLFGMKKNPFPRGRNCSEEIGNILKLEGYEINKDVNLLTPKDIFQILSKKHLTT
jgi:hypothetical protein